MSKIFLNEYMDLAGACLYDDYTRVKDILDKFPEIDLNTGRNGTPLILTGSAKIGKLLLDRGANINQEFDHTNAIITALDSANEELTKVKTSDDTKTMVKEYITFLKENGAKTYEELQGEK